VSVVPAKGPNSSTGLLRRQNQDVWVADPSVCWIRGQVVDVSAGKAQVEVDGAVRSSAPVFTLQVRSVGTSEKELLPCNPPHLEDVDSLMQQDFLHAASLLHTLAIRYVANKIYVPPRALHPLTPPPPQTYCGPVLISVNPYQQLPLYTPAVVETFFSSRSADEAPPHVFAIADRAYKAMVLEGSNESILITSVTGE
jgi:myosin V